MKLAALALAIWSLTSSLPTAVLAEDQSDGNIMVARSGAHALVLWDATPLVMRAVSNNVNRPQALREIESKATIFAAQKAQLLHAAQTIAIRVIYTRSGDLNPVYKTATFAGIERLVTLTSSRSQLIKNGHADATALLAGNVPKNVTLDVTGKLP